MFVVVSSPVRIHDIYWRCVRVLSSTSMSVRYCSKECQAHHWKEGGHRKECSKLRKLYNECVVIDAPLSSKTGVVNPSFFRKPSYAPILATFTLKVEIVEDSTEGGRLLHLCDKTKECDFLIGQELHYTKLYKMVQAEPLTAGAHAYVVASFDPTGKCTLYVNRRKTKTW
jgi:MYND finger